ncbi:MAG: sugar phosphate nucleotidyltransferase [Patescibacteria group bacterium]|mgnify:CR=1 FL=1
MNAIILCGGLSTRLGEIAKKIPKVLLGIKGKTVLEWQLEKLKHIGITEVVLAAGHLAEVLRKSVGLHLDGVDLIYAIEQEKLGTGGAIKHAWEYATKQGEPVVVLNGDVLTNVDLADVADSLDKASDGLIFGAKVEDAASYGTLVYDKNFHLKKFKEKEGLRKPGYINGGIYIFTEKAKKYFPQKKSFSIEYDVFPKMKHLYVYESDKPWVDIGVPERLEWAKTNWKE